MSKPSDFETCSVQDIRDCTSRILEFMKNDTADIGVKSAALRSASDLLNSAINNRAMAEMLSNVLTPRR